MKDTVIENAEAVLAKAKAALKNAESRLDEVKKSMLRSDNSIRQSASLEAAQRTIEIEALRERVAQHEKGLASAVADLPRREQERKRAADLTAKADAVDQKAVSLLEQLKDVELEASGLRAEATQALEAASATLQVLERRAAQRKAADEKTRQEAREHWERESNLARREYEGTKASSHPDEERIAEKKKVLEICEKNLEAADA